MLANILVPPRLAAIWFPSNEVSTATSIGVFGNQLGVAFGFIIPPAFVAGPIKSWESVAGGYPDDWANVEKYGEKAQDSIDEVSDQVSLMFIGGLKFL